MASKRTILITGCSDGGLGSALALTFHKSGWRVFASARNLSKLKQATAAGIETIELDVNSEESIAASVLKVQELTGGSLDVLLNNAGAGYSMPLLDLDMDKTRDLFDLNVFSLITMTRAYFPLLRKSTRKPMLVNNTSVVSISAGAVPFQGAYNASKAAAAGLTEAYRGELAPFGIKVVNMMTGIVRSHFFDNAPSVTLPPNSVYNVAKEVIEKAMSGEEAAVLGTDPFKWAEGVVKDLEKRNPPHWVWQGQYASLVRVSSLLPIGMMDGFMKSKLGLDVLERNIQEQGKANKGSS
ncbi:hypothetical protein G7Z17_g3668 [Cylindrodendrum hubeiense]|uniref:Uncharacterized protein n=1 Tax=Cylindrodendrum hubeiense TaxID=595255 RepID=A0A9P5LHY4_9HYPO|nr:hypothetical protein G7Z17_g3668 [Cylindrodendrum hubeiense]